MTAPFDPLALALPERWLTPRLILRCPTPADAPQVNAAVTESLERLRHLAPLTKPGVLKACCAAAFADGQLRLAEVELVRMVAATLDCPMPPLVTQADPASLRA